MNNDNLKTLSSSEAREYGKIGGIKSGQVRRERKSFRDHLLMLLNAGDTQDKLCTAILQKALNGDIKAFEVIRDTIGEKPNPTDAEKNTIKPVSLVRFITVDSKTKEEKEMLQH